MTEYWNLMSDGAHTLVGSVYPRVLVLPNIFSFGATLDERLGNANGAVIDSLDADSSINFSSYDWEPDGTVDFVFVVYRGKFGTNNVQLTGANGGFGTLALPGGATSKFVDGGTMAVSNVRGANVVMVVQNRGPSQIRGTMIHEYGHSLSVQIASLNPAIPNNHIPTIARYGLMDGTASATRGDGVFETVLRSTAGWATPMAVIAFPPTDLEYELEDVATHANSGFLRIHTQDPKQYFLVEIRDSTSTAFTNGTTLMSPLGCETSRGPSGLVIYHVSEHTREGIPSCSPAVTTFVDGWWNGYRPNGGGFVVEPWECAAPGCGPPEPECCPNEKFPPFIDIEASGGMFNETSFVPDPASGYDQMSCFTCENNPLQSDGNEPFRPGDACVFGPYTNPSSNLYWYSPNENEYEDIDNCALRQQQSIPSGITIYNLEWVVPPGGGNGKMKFRVRYDDPATVSGAWPLPDDMVIDGKVQLMTDVKVAQGKRVEVKKGSVIYAAANQDLLTNSDGKVKILNEGELDILGDYPLGPSGKKVTLTSTRDPGFVHFLGTGENGQSATNQDWLGLEMNLSGCSCTGYGYSVASQPYTDVQGTEVKNSKYGVRMKAACVPNLKDVFFSNIEGNRDIYADGTDLFLPGGYWPNGCVSSVPLTPKGEWDIPGGAHVVFSNVATNDLPCVGVPGKSDFLVDGNLKTRGSPAAGDSVYFRPETITPINQATAGQDWGGMLFSTQSSGSNVRFANIGYAANPLFVSYPDGSTFKHCLIHHFADLGVWFKGSNPNGAVLDSSIVDRGLDLHGSLGDTGIYVDQADETHILSTLVNLQDRLDITGGVGIDVRFGKTFCQTDPADARLVVIDNCQVLGPSQAAQLGTYYSGIRTNWVCGSLMRDVEITKNYVAEWKFVGLELLQSADLQASCNQFTLCRSGVDIYRDSEPTGTSMRFRRNQIQATEPDPALYAVRSNNNPRTKLGPSWGQLYGFNQLTVNVNDTKFVVETDATSGNILNARDNFWFTKLGTTSTLLTNATDIQNRIVESPVNQVDITDFETILPIFAPDCNPLPPSLSLQGLQSVVLGDSPATDALAIDLPRHLELGAAFPNPATSGEFDLSLSVPPDRTGSFFLVVYDLGGRRLLEARHDIETGGRYRLKWDGRSGDRQKVSTGIYFLRVTGPGGFEQTRKVAVLR